MIDASAVHDAVEATAMTPKSSFCNQSTNATRQSILAHRDALLRFLEEIDGDMSVSELREALEDYG